MSVHTLKIDGSDVAGAAGQTILDVARENGIDIPTLCHLDGLSATSAPAACAWSRSAAPQAAAGLRDRGRAKAWR